MRRTLVLFMVASSMAVGQSVQTLHVSSIHKATDNEKTYHTAFGQQFIEGTIGKLHYTLTNLTGWAGCNVEIGKDYEVVKVKKDSVVIRTPVGKKDKLFNCELPVQTVSE